MQKIHIVIHTLNHSGLVHAAVMLANGLVKKDYEVNLVVVGYRTTSPYLIDNKIKIKFLNINRGNSQIGKIKYFLKSCKLLKKYIKTHNAKNIFVWGKEFTSVAVFLRSIFRMKIKIIGVNVTSLKGHLSSKQHIGGFAKYFYLKIYRLVFKKADYIIVQSRSMLCEIKDLLSLNKNRISVTYPALSYKFFNVRIYKERSNEIIFLGRLSNEKNPEKCLKAFTKIKNKNVNLRFLGDGELMPKLREIRRNLGFRDRVFFEGSKDNVVPYLQKAKLLVLSSRYEGFGMVLAEAIACGTPVIAVDCPVGPSEIVEDGVNGYLVDLNDDEALVKSIDKALDRKWDYKKIPKTVEKFHPDNILPDYIKVINKVYD